MMKCTDKNPMLMFGAELLLVVAGASPSTSLYLQCAGDKGHQYDQMIV